MLLIIYITINVMIELILAKNIVFIINESFILPTYSTLYLYHNILFLLLTFQYLIQTTDLS